MHTISASELKTRLDNDEVILIDVREIFEHQAESIDNAYLIPLATLCCAKLPSQNKVIVMHCRSGMRSMDAVKKLLKENPKLEVYSLEGGIVAWKNAGYPVKIGSCKLMGLDRQTQIAAGSFVLLGLVLGAWVHPYFYGLSAFIGGGLIFAGISGCCGLSKILATMPWNKI